MRRLELFLDAKAANTPPRGISKASRVIFPVLTLLFLSIGQVWGKAGDKLYECTFPVNTNQSYTMNYSFTRESKSWKASVAQINGSVFYLGCSSTHASKGILAGAESGNPNNNGAWDDVISAWEDADNKYGTSVHAYALRFDNAYDNVGEVTFAWEGGNNAFCVFLFGDKGDGLELLDSTYYATSGQSVAGAVTWTGSTSNFSSFAIVARPGTKTTNASNKTIRAKTFTIKEGTVSSCDKKVNISKGTPEEGGSFNIDKTGEQDCCSALTVTLSSINAPSGKHFKQITQSGIASGVTIDNDAKTVTYAATSNGNSEINVEFEDNPSHDIIFHTNGGTCETSSISVKEGVTYSTLPTVTGLSSYCEYGTFVGWTDETSISNGAKPTMVTSVTMGDNDVDLYAVYSKTESGEGPSGNTSINHSTLALDSYADGEDKGDYSWDYTQLRKGDNNTIQGNSSKVSILWNTEEFPAAISKVVLEVGATCGPSSTSALSFGSSVKPTSADIALGSGTDYSISTTGTLEITEGIPANSTYMSLSWTSGASYYTSVTIYWGGGTTTYSLEANCCTPYAITANGVGGELILAPNLTEACADTEITLTANSPNGSHQGEGVIKVVETADPENDITSTVYNSGTGVLTMPGYAITITATYAEKSTPSAAADPAALDFGSPLQGASVAAQTFSLTGSALVAGTLTLVAPSGYTVSPSEIAVSAGSLSATEITVTPNTETAGDKSGNITISGAGIASTNLVALTMNVQETYTVNWYINNDAEPYAHQTDVAGTTLTIPDDFSSFTDCQDLSFVGWSESAIGSSPAAEKPTFAEVGTTITANKNYYAVFAEGSAGGTTWTRVTATSTLLAGGTFIMGYEATANSGEIVPMRNSDVNGASTTADGFVRSGTTAGSSTNGTITMSSLGTNGGDAYEVAIEAGTTSGTIAIKLANNYYVGKPTSGNKVRLFSDKSVLTDMTPELKDDDVIRLKFSADSALSYNANANQERFARYKSQNDVVFYKKSTSADTYHNWVTVCPHCNSVALSKAGESAGNTFALQRNSADVTSVHTCEAVTVDVVASPATGYELTNIEVNGVTGASVNVEFTQISIPQDADGTLTVTATFSQKNYSIAVQTYPASIGATLTGATSTAKYGVPQTISTDEPTGYLFGGWYLFDASTFDAENINWNADLSSEIFTGTYKDKDLELEASFLMTDKNLVAVAYFDKLYTVSEFLALGEKSTTETYYIQGLVSNVQGYYSSKYITYYISDNGEGGSGATTLKIYNGLDENGTSFTNINNLTVGDKVIVEGKWDSEHSNIGANNKLYYHQILSLSSVVVSAPDASLVKSEYFTGETFSYAGLKATAVYNTGYQKDVTSEATFKANGSATLTVSGNTTVNVTAAWNETTSADYPVTITVTTKVLQPELTLSETALTGYLGQALPKPATITAHFVDNTVPSTENVTLQAVIDENDVYDASSTAEQTIPVKYTFGPNDATANYTVTLSSIVNTIDAAYSVEKARDIIDLDRVDGNNLDLANADNKVYVVGRITAKTNNEITIKDDADETKVLYLWKYEIDTEISSVEVGDLIKAYGNLYYHAQSGKYELNEGCEIVWKQPKVSIEISNQTMEVDGTLTISDVATIDPAAAPVSYAIVANDDNCITLNESTGLITAVATGTATVSITVEAYQEYLGNSKTFTVTVKPAAVHTSVVLYAEYNGEYFALNNQGKATQINVSGGKVVVANEDTKGAIVWDRAERAGVATFYNAAAHKYLNGSNSTTLNVVASEGDYTSWTWKEAGYYTSNTGTQTIRTFLYRASADNGFMNYAQSNKGTGDYAGYTIVYTGEVIVGTIETLREGATWTGEKWGTYCPRYNVKAMEGASFYQLNYMELNADGSPYKFFFDEIGEGANLEAGKPYLFITEEDVTTIKGVKYGDAAADGLHVYNGFVGYLGSGNYDLSSDYDVYTAGANNYYGLQNNIFKLIYGGNSYMVNERAFIQITPTSKPATTEQPAPAYSRRRLVVGAGAPQVATGTDELNASETPVKVMIDGKFYILRGEKMYDATGRLVK